jgi:unsaturated chondroitin disaccharide hydrolase
MQTTPTETPLRVHSTVLALAQIDDMLARFAVLYPDDTTHHQQYQVRRHPGFTVGGNVGWTTGFWTGMLWMAYELSGEPRYRTAAEAHLPGYAQRLRDRIQVDHHDLGFLYMPSCVAAARLTGNDSARTTALAAADCLMERYLPNAGIIQAWGDLRDPAQRGRMIIDCLMNLPLLHWASAQTGNPAYRNAAISHALRSQQYLVRPNASSYHTYHFDRASGEAIRGSTHQGHADDSCWARGQAWGIYGFALNHRYLPGSGLLDTAIRQADYFLAHLPANRIAYWDLVFDDDSGEPWDSSASAIAVCGLLELASQMPPCEQQLRYRREAQQILSALERYCSARQPECDGLLAHGVYHKRGGEGVDEASLWGDYFYLEALARQQPDWVSHW